VAQLTDLGIDPFDLVVSNLYPFTDTVSSGASEQECIEQIDIGGPSMMRAAAKNHASVAIVTNPSEYGSVLVAVRGGGFTLSQRKTLAAEAFVHTASYDFAVASWMGSVLTDTSDGTGFPRGGRDLDTAKVLRYGETRTRRRRSTPTGAPESPRQSSSMARRCPTTTSSTPMPPSAPPTTTVNRQWPSSSTPTRADRGRRRHRPGVPAGARVRPAVRFRELLRQPSRDSGNGRASPLASSPKSSWRRGTSPEALEISSARRQFAC